MPGTPASAPRSGVTRTSSCRPFEGRPIPRSFSSCVILPNFRKVKNPVLRATPDLTVEAKRETRYYAEQSEMMAKFLRILGLSLTIIFSLGAIIGAMMTMYSAVANRTAEIGTLRALGFPEENHPPRFSRGIIAARFSGRRGRPFLRLFHAALHHIHHELSDLLRTRLQFLHHLRDHLQGPGLLIWSWALSAASSPPSGPRA